jgi:hypothetical protein
MNITLAIEDRLVEKARRKADANGTSLNQVVRDQIRKYAGEDDPASIIEEFLNLPGNGNSRGWRFNRDEVHERG